MSNKKTEDFAVDVVMQIERREGREPVDVRRAGASWDVSSPPRNIEVKAFGGSARGEPIPIEKRQAEAALADPASFYLYVVDNVALAMTVADEVGVRVIPGEAVLEMIKRTTPSVTYWPTLRVADYDQAERFSSQ